ncbi:site-specific DNA-methyltransferase [Caenimonas koreensis DSM 17982]|uniref:Site-specific DNA-methyltransferase n=1 Tax=Caenimonas koreensis DSM 17982 TaxID=1121255 RepID=A0A844B107_9BURK|nr:site-specific DNA-methyltransferase [Caenimonas koreensis]MRD46972.1 site-specific DNA-methyltransferase [Caenimonas koreensis DSM 17982]
MPFLDWVNKSRAKEATRAVPYHLLQQEGAFGEPADNLLIQGDNLLALKALIPFYAGRVKCIFIDPPYNTQSAFEHYDDKLEHSQWLSMMYPRLVVLRDLLSEDGSIWVTIDDNEAHYLKVLMDEVFGRRRFIANCVWQKRYARDNNAAIGSSHDHLLVYATNQDQFRTSRNLVEIDDKTRAAYRNANNDPKGPWRLVPMNGAGLRPNQQYPIRTPSGKTIYPPEGRHWSVLEDKFKALVAEGRVSFGKNADSAPGLIRYISEVQGLVPWSWWPHDEVGNNDQAKKEIHELFGTANAFDTPKPERLIQRILHIATSPGDLILDSFLGSGTTAAVAHKMGRRYIGIEMGEHARTHCLPRLQKVINGEQGGISAAVGWQGGGGFRFCTLGDPAFDDHGRISADVKFATLAAYVWHFETGEPGHQAFDKPLLGVHNGTAYYLLFNGILGDRRPAGGNVLTHAVLKAINEVFPHGGPKVVYGEMSRLGASRLAAEGVTFKQVPYDIKMR